MTRFLKIAALAAIAQFGTPATAELIAWEELIDQDAQVYEDPYLGIEYDQLEDLRTVAMETARLDADGLSEDERAASTLKLEQARSELADAGIDADWLISQRWVVAERRERAATSANPDVDGKTVTLAGFAIPAPPEDDGTIVVYIVPERGMCSHMPPPNANQMVRVRLGMEWTPEMMHQPVRLTGKLSIAPSEHVFTIVDGPVRMQASLKMDAHDVQTLGSFSSRTPSINITPHSTSN